MAAALTSVVLLQPGGPCSSTPLHGARKHTFGKCAWAARSSFELMPAPKKGAQPEWPPTWANPPCDYPGMTHQPWLQQLRAMPPHARLRSAMACLGGVIPMRLKASACRNGHSTACLRTCRKQQMTAHTHASRSLWHLAWPASGSRGMCPDCSLQLLLHRFQAAYVVPATGSGQGAKGRRC